MARQRLIHADRAQLGMLDVLLLASGTVVFLFGLMILDIGVIAIGALAGAFFLLTVHRTYELNEDALVISYWALRRRTIPRRAIVSAHRVKLPLKPESIMIERAVGGGGIGSRLIITPADVPTFLSHLPHPGVAKQAGDTESRQEVPGDASGEQGRRRRRRGPRRRR